MPTINKTWAIIGGIIAIILIAVISFFSFYIGTYNDLVTLSNGIEGQWAQVENQLQRRNDLIPNLVKVVKGYAKHEKDVFTAIADARSRLAGAKTTDDKVKANNDMTGALSRLLMVVENYPTLQANKNFLALQDQLEGTENRIAVERGRFNEIVRIYNTKVQSFPASWVARKKGFVKKPYIEVPKAKQEVPNVDL